MIKLLLSSSIFFATILCSVSPGLSQVWEWLNPKPQGDGINQILFVNKLTGFFIPRSANIYKTTNGGESWERIPTDVIFANIYFVSENTGFGLGSHQFNDRKYGIYRTKDGGLTWQQVFQDSPYRGHDIQFIDSKIGWVIGNSNLWYTSDGGDTWTEQAQDQSIHDREYDLKLSFRDANRGWIGGWQSFAFKTLDGGQSWTRDSTLAAYTKFSLVDTTYGWASGLENSDYQLVRVMRTEDGGLSWLETPSAMTGIVYPFSPDTCIVLADDWMNRGIYKTTDGGTNWEMVSTKRYKSAFFINQQEIWSSLNHSIDGGRNWENKTVNIFAPGIDRLNTVDFVDAETGWVAGTNFPSNKDLFIAKTTDGGASWFKQISDLPFEILKLHFVDNEVGWGIGRGGLIKKTSDGGQTWITQESGVSFKLRDLIFLDRLIGWIVGDEGLVLKTMDGGLTWNKVSTGYTLHFDDVCFVDSSHGWIAGSPYIETPITFLRTTDGGQTWNNPITDNTSNIYRFSFINPAQGWASSQNRDFVSSLILATSDSGKTWEEQYPIPYNISGAVKFIDGKQGWVIGTYGWIFHTRDGGNTWINQRENTTSVVIVDFDIAESRAWAVGYKGMILKADLSKLSTSVNFENSIITQTDFHQDQIYPSYPNPLNGIATIRFDLSLGGEVTFELFDILGRRKKVLNMGWKEPGSHKIMLDTANLTSAIYVYRLTTSRSVLIGKLSVIK